MAIMALAAVLPMLGDLSKTIGDAAKSASPLGQVMNGLGGAKNQGVNFANPQDASKSPMKY
ncbi:hypothetical protein OOJ96_01980 [Pseudomonas sp. 15FMM2]|uniref:Uncharacterized protein n=1 Tax=Pseudomonas imrae TaxID=2992837 RepID=A0ACC7P989_9PSED